MGRQCIVSRTIEAAVFAEEPHAPSRSPHAPMKVLLDTHVFLWMHGEPGRLSARAEKLLVDAETGLSLSVVVSWEMGSKIARERLTRPEPLEADVTSRVRRSRMSLLSSDLAHVLEAV